MTRSVRTPAVLTIRGLMMLMLAPVAAGCAGAGAGARRDRTIADEPVIDSIVPDSAPASPAIPTVVSIYGMAFDSLANDVRFGTLIVRSLPASRGGTKILLPVPTEFPASGEVPPAALYPGEYQVRVSTARGTSNAVVFRLTR